VAFCAFDARCGDSTSASHCVILMGQAQNEDLVRRVGDGCGRGLAERACGEARACHDACEELFE
jgi:hypothetical protein